MKLLRYGSAGQEKPGLLDSNGTIRDLSGLVPDIAGDVLLPESLAKLRKVDPSSLPRVNGTPRIGPCVGQVGKLIAIGLNYSDHAAESGMAVPKEPIVFMKATSCIVGPNDNLEIPRGSQKTDWEVELAVVIGEPASYVSEADARKVIAGYCVCHDVSERTFQLEGTGQWTKGKGCPTFGPVGPWLVTPDEVGNVQSLSMWLDVNGERMQTGSTSTMIFNVHFLVSYISSFMALEPGDIITTGTPPGVGMGKKPTPRFLRAGDVVRLGIEKLGEQQQTCIAFKA
jgi:2-keto-4-pentenoate hydratase/2-oxohepta-3-ene-1,7-dioic acid hydratase in catechol pathway